MTLFQHIIHWVAFYSAITICDRHQEEHDSLNLGLEAVKDFQ